MVHPTLQIFVPDTLQTQLILLHQNQQKKHKHHKRQSPPPPQLFHVIGFSARKHQTQSGHRDQHRVLLQVSIVALSSAPSSPTSTSSHGQLQPCGYQDDEIVGQLLFEHASVGPPPAWTSLPPPDLEHPCIFISWRLSAGGLKVERVVLDGVVLPPDPSSLILFQYNPQTLNQAHHLRHLPEKESGLPEILRAVFRPLPRDRRDIIPLQGEEWPPDEVAVDPFGDFLLGGGGEKWSESKEESPVSRLKSRIINRSMGVKQFVFRLQLLSNLLYGKLSRLGASNLLALLFLDIVLGVLYSQFLHSFPHLYSTLHSQIHHLLKLLLGLLNWLRGSPAGLKLNSALNSLLWRFFSYHLHLWANYIGILEPILSLILSIIIWVGPLGFSVQLCLMKDLLSMATFHVYCLYIYAARLYRVLIVAIKALGRLFLGRKWNPLRNRVDHVALSISEMFLGALFFTIAIFLAPTVIIYYAVFLSLRLPVLFLERILDYIVAIFNSLRLVTSALILLHSPRVCDQILLDQTNTLLNHEQDQHSPPQFRILLQATKPPFIIPSHSFAFVETITSTVQGHVLNR